ncbi:MAG: hypothetical protein L6R40_004267 [Gallowayella cf. fulva]|nr:MAG: hypothetical protein L6R40_004267 [Xanthomendoza cf. fulva]
MLPSSSLFALAFAAVSFVLALSPSIQNPGQPPHAKILPTSSNSTEPTDWPVVREKTHIPGENLYFTIDNYGFIPISPRWALAVAQDLAIIESYLRKNLTQQVWGREWKFGPVKVTFSDPLYGVPITPSQAAVVIRLLRFWTIAFGGPKEILAGYAETSQDMLASFTLKIALRSHPSRPAHG